MTSSSISTTIVNIGGTKHLNLMVRAISKPYQLPSYCLLDMFIVTELLQISKVLKVAHLQLIDGHISILEAPTNNTVSIALDKNITRDGFYNLISKAFSIDSNLVKHYF